MKIFMNFHDKVYIKLIMIVEMENYNLKSRVTNLKAIDTNTPRYFVILYSCNSVTSLIWCHFRLQILAKKSILASEYFRSLIKQENWYLSNEVTFSSILLSSFDFQKKKNLWSDLLYNYLFFCKISLNFVKEIWSYCIYIKLSIFWMFTILPMFFEHVLIKTVARVLNTNLE